MRPSFLRLPVPYLCAITSEETLADTLADMRMAEHDGAQAFVVDLSRLADDERTDSALERIFHLCGRPAMPLCYRYFQLEHWDDDRRAKLMLDCVRAGAAGVDIMGDLYAPSPDERTTDPAAIDKQKALIDEVHSMGAEALISSHTNRVMTKDEVLTHMLDLESRGADIVKLVAYANTKAELVESLSATVALSETLRTPFVHLVSGRWARLQRYVSPMLGACLTFGVERYDALSMGPQPLIASAREVLRELAWNEEYPSEEA